MTKNFKLTSPISQVKNIYSQTEFNYEAVLLEDNIQSSQVRSPKTIQNDTILGNNQVLRTWSGPKPYFDKKHTHTKSKSNLSVKHQKFEPFFFNGCFDKNRIKLLVSWSLQNCGQKMTIDLIENLKNLGFSYATQAGISLGIDDLQIPPTKNTLISTAEKNIKKTHISYKKEYLSGIEKFQHLIDTWHRTSEILKQNVISHFKLTDILNPVYMMAFSGARGNVSQVRQLVGMRGLMSDPQGQILDFPIKSNFREGITLTEYIISCYGARKGLVDTALKTANSGYLTRRLVDVSHHIIVSDLDCKTKRGVILADIFENKKIIVPLKNRLIGRILAENIYSNSSPIGEDLNLQFQSPNRLAFQAQKSKPLSQIVRLSSSNKTTTQLQSDLFLGQVSVTESKQKLTSNSNFPILKILKDTSGLLRYYNSDPNNLVHQTNIRFHLILQNIFKPQNKQIHVHSREKLRFSGQLAPRLGASHFKNTNSEHSEVSFSKLLGNQVRSTLFFYLVTKSNVFKTLYQKDAFQEIIENQSDFNETSNAQLNNLPNKDVVFKSEKPKALETESLDNIKALTGPKQEAFGYQPEEAFQAESAKHLDTEFFQALGVKKVEAFQALRFAEGTDTEYQIFTKLSIEYVLFSNYVTCYTAKKKLLARKNQEISAELSVKIANLKKSVLVRSPLTCQIKNSICQLCYGWSLAHGKLVSLGEAVGVLAAQSIGEPGTQLTMRTFHTGGVFSGDIMSEITAPFDGKILFPSFLEGMLIRTPHGKIAFLTKVQGSVEIQKEKLTKKDSIILQVPALTVLFVRNGEYITKGQVIAEFSSMSTDANQRIQASQDINAEIEGEIYFKNVLLNVRKKKNKLISRTTCNLGSIWVLAGKICQQTIPINLFLQPGDLVNNNSIIAQYETISSSSGFSGGYPNLKRLKKNRPAKHVVNPKQNVSKSFYKHVPSTNQPLSRINHNSKLPSSQVPSTNFLKESKILLSQSKAANGQVPNISDNLNLDNKNWLHYPLISYSVQSIQYKKIGYLFSFSKKKNLQFNFLDLKQSVLKQHQFFLSNSLKKKFLHSNNLNKKFFFKSFPIQYQTQTAGKLIYDHFYLNKKTYSGEIFWISQETCLLNTRSSYTNLINYFLRVFTKTQSNRLASGYNRLGYKVLDNSNQVSKSQGGHVRNNSEAGCMVSLSDPTTTLKLTTQTKITSNLLNKNNTKFITKKNLTSFYHNAQGKFFVVYSQLSGYTEYSLLSRFIYNKINRAVPKRQAFRYELCQAKIHFSKKFGKALEVVGSPTQQPATKGAKHLDTELCKTEASQTHFKQENLSSPSQVVRLSSSNKTTTQLQSDFGSSTIYLNNKQGFSKPQTGHVESTKMFNIQGMLNLEGRPWKNKHSRKAAKYILQNNRIYSFNYKFYQISFYLNPCVKISYIVRRNLKIKNAIKKKKIFLLFENSNQQVFKKTFQALRKPEALRAVLEIESVSYENRYESDLGIKYKKTNLKLSTKQRFILLRPQFPWKVFSEKTIIDTRNIRFSGQKTVKKLQNRSCFMTTFFYNEREKKIVHNSLINTIIDPGKTPSRVVRLSLTTQLQSAQPDRFASFIQPSDLCKVSLKEVLNLKQDNLNQVPVKHIPWLPIDLEKIYLTVKVQKHPKINRVNTNVEILDTWSPRDFEKLKNEIANIKPLKRTPYLPVGSPYQQLRLTLLDMESHKQSKRVKQNLIKVTIKPGWVFLQDTEHCNFLPRETFGQIIKKDKKIIKAGEVCFTNVSFDQYPVYYQCLAVKKMSLQDNKFVRKKNNTLQKQRQFTNIYKNFISVENTFILKPKASRYNLRYIYSQSAFEISNSKTLCEQIPSTVNQKTVLTTLRFFKLCHNLFFNKHLETTLQADIRYHILQLLQSSKFTNTKRSNSSYSKLEALYTNYSTASKIGDCVTTGSDTKYTSKNFYENKLDIIYEKLLLEKNIKKNFLSNQPNLAKIYFVKNENFLASPYKRFIDIHYKPQSEKCLGTQYLSTQRRGTKLLANQVRRNCEPASQETLLKKHQIQSKNILDTKQNKTLELNINCDASNYGLPVFIIKNHNPTGLPQAFQALRKAEDMALRKAEDIILTSPRDSKFQDLNDSAGIDKILPFSKKWLGQRPYQAEIQSISLKPQSRQVRNPKVLIVITKVRSYCFNGVTQYKKLLSQENKIVPPQSNYFSDLVIPEAKHLNNTKQVKDNIIRKKALANLTLPYNQVRSISDHLGTEKRLDIKYNPKQQTSVYIQTWSSNKQNITHLFLTSPAPDFYLKFSFNHRNYKNIVFYKTISIFQYYIRFVIPKNYKRHFTKLSFIQKDKNFRSGSTRALGLKNQKPHLETEVAKQLCKPANKLKNLSKAYNLNLISHLNVSILMEVDSHPATIVSRGVRNVDNARSLFKLLPVYPFNVSLFFSQNYIGRETPSSYTTLLSAYPGEILNIGFSKKNNLKTLGAKTSSVIDTSDLNVWAQENSKKTFQETILDLSENKVEKQSYLTLTSNEQVNFYIEHLDHIQGNLKKIKTDSEVDNNLETKNFQPITDPIFLGKNIRYGTKVNSKSFHQSAKPVGTEYLDASHLEINSVPKNALLQTGQVYSTNLVIPLSGSIIQIQKSRSQSEKMQGTIITLRKAQPILFSSKGLVSVYEGDIIEKNTLILRLFYQRLKTGDIVQGIPKIEQLFEARKTNQGELLHNSLHQQLEKIFSYYIHLPISFQSPNCEAIKSGVRLMTTYPPLCGEPGRPTQSGEPESQVRDDGLDKFNRASRYSLRKIQEIIVSSVQRVYRSQGVTIADKHLEIVVRQMTSKVQVIRSGQTNLLPGEIIDLDWIEVVNEGIEDMNKKAKYIPVILGITRKSLETKSFISEASFQETTRVLAKSAIERKTDFLKGLKENVILGNLVPAGTGFLSVKKGQLFSSDKRFSKQANLAQDGLDSLESYTLFRNLFFQDAECEPASQVRRFAETT